MAHRGVIIAGSWTLKEDIGEGIFFKVSAPAANNPDAQKVETCDTAGELPFGVIPVYPQPTDANNPKQDPAHSPPDRGAKEGDLLYGHYAGPPSEIIEGKLGAAIAQDNTEVVVNASGELIALGSQTDVHVIGRVPMGADGDIVEVQVMPRYVP